MAVHGPIFFFDNGEALFQRRKRKLLSLVENLDEDGKSSKPEDGITEKDGPECETRASGIISKDVTKENNQILYHQDLIAKIEEDAKFFIDGDSTDTLPSLHKFLPLLKQAILTFDELNFSEKVKKTVHDKYHEMRPLSNGIFEELAAIFEQEEIFSPDVASPEIKVVLFSTSNQLIQDTEIEYREWQMGHAPQAATGKLASQNLSSELHFPLMAHAVESLGSVENKEHSCPELKMKEERAAGLMKEIQDVGKSLREDATWFQIKAISLKICISNSTLRQEVNTVVKTKATERGRMV